MKIRKLILAIPIIVFLSCFLTEPYLCAIDLSVTKAGESPIQARVSAEALKHAGVPYLTGGATKKGFDCSGLVYRVYLDAASVELPRLVEELMNRGEPVTGPLMKADLLFFDTDGKGKPSHVGISTGGSKFVHAASQGSKTGVIVSELTEDYYKKRYLGAKRIIPHDNSLIKIVLTNLVPVEQRFPEGIVPGLPLFVTIENRLQKAVFLTVKTYRDGKLIVSRRVKANPSEPSTNWFIPDEGDWSISVEDVKNDEIAAIMLY